MVRQITGYLAAHPSASDNLEGILNWWIPRQQFEESRARAEQALDYLVSEKRVQKKVLVDGQVIYRGRNAEDENGPD